MTVIDWLIVIFPVSLVMFMAWRTKKYAKDVTNFISSGRTCGRYVITVGDVAESLAVLTLVSYIESHYRNGFGTSFWGALLMPLGVILSLFGYCTYRMRETKAQSLGQFIEMRYSRKLRVFAAALRCTSEMLTNMIMPSIAARFFIYFWDLPLSFELLGMTVSTFHVIMFAVLALAISIILLGGSIAINITDTIQGFFCYPMLIIMVVFIMCKFSWSEQIFPVLTDKVPGESLINPTDIKKLRDFNLFSALAVPIMVRFLQRVSWFGGGASSTAAKSAHEQKMAGLLGTWRGALGSMFYILIALAVMTMMNHHDFTPQAHKVRMELTSKIAGETIKDTNLREAVVNEYKKMQPVKHIVGVDPKHSDKDNIDTKYLAVGHQVLTAADVDTGNTIFSKFRTLYFQLMLPVSFRSLLPVGMMGLFSALMIMLMVSTDDSRIFSSAVGISQDVILPFIKKPLSPEKHMMLLRVMSVLVGVFFFCGSSFMSQLDYITLFGILMSALWCGGCGPVLVLGLYTRFGTTAGAWTSLISSVIIGSFGVFIQRNWANIVYPFLRDHNMLESTGSLLTFLSKPFNPYIVWEMDPVRCPINSYELYFFTMIITLVLYIVVSLLTCKEPFNLDRMLHRGKYSDSGVAAIQSPWTRKNLYNKLVGITPEYTTGDKVIAWSYFFYSFVYRFGITFIAVFVWNMITPWPIEHWGLYFIIVYLTIPSIMAAITTVWFGIGGIIDLRQMFRDLDKREVDHLDNGMVEGHVSLSDKAKFNSLDK